MSTLTKKIKRIGATFNAKAEKMAALHPTLFFVASFIGTPLVTLAGVFACISALALPLGLMLGWF